MRRRFANSGDEARRRHERAGERVLVLIDRYRRGDLSSFNLKAAAWLGHDVAVEAARRLGVRFLSGASEPDRELAWDEHDDGVLANREDWDLVDSGDGYRVVNMGEEDGEDDDAREWVRVQALAGNKLAIKALIFLRDLAKSDDYDYFAYGREVRSDPRPTPDHRPPVRPGRRAGRDRLSSPRRLPIRTKSRGDHRRRGNPARPAD